MWRYRRPISGEIQRVEGLAIDDAGVVTVSVATLEKGGQVKRLATWVLDRTGAVVSRTSARWGWR